MFNSIHFFYRRNFTQIKFTEETNFSPSNDNSSKDYNKPNTIQNRATGQLAEEYEVLHRVNDCITLGQRTHGYDVMQVATDYNTAGQMTDEYDILQDIIDHTKPGQRKHGHDIMKHITGNNTTRQMAVEYEILRDVIDNTKPGQGVHKYDVLRNITGNTTRAQLPDEYEVVDSDNNYEILSHNHFDTVTTVHPYVAIERVHDNTA